MGAVVSPLTGTGHATPAASCANCGARAAFSLDASALPVIPMTAPETTPKTITTSSGERLFTRQEINN